MSKIKRDFMQEEYALEEEVKKSGLDLYSFIKYRIMNMPVERNCNTSTYIDMVKAYSQEQGRSFRYLKDDYLFVKDVKKIIEFLDERFTIIPYTFFKQEIENPYFLDNLMALNLNYEFYDKPARFRQMPVFEIIDLIQQLQAERGPIKKKTFYDMFPGLQANGEDSSYFPEPD